MVFPLTDRTRVLAKSASWRRALCLLLCGILLCGVMPFPAATATESVNELTAQKNELAEQQKELEAKRDETAKTLEEQKEQMNILKQQITTASNKIAVNEQLIAELDTQIAQKASEIATQEETIAALNFRIEEQYQQLRSRLRAISKTAAGATSLMYILDSDSYADYLISSKAAERISAHDQALMDGLEADIVTVEAAKAETEKAKAELETERTAREETRAELQADKDKIQAMYAEEEDLANEMAANVEYLNEQIAELDAKQAALQNTIDDVLAKLKAEEEANKQNGVAPPAYNNGGTMTWPTPTCRVITSSYKYRPQFGRWHKGLDIARYGDATGHAIVAAADGTVVYANRYDSWGGGYGLYLMIDHGYDSAGQRIMTIYAHCNQVTAYEGLTVKAGDLIGYVGNTGNSFGAHLHFEVQVNGTAVNPVSAGYVSTSGIDVLG